MQHLLISSGKHEAVPPQALPAVERSAKHDFRRRNTRLIRQAFRVNQRAKVRWQHPIATASTANVEKYVYRISGPLCTSLH